MYCTVTVNIRQKIKNSVSFNLAHNIWR